MREIEVLAPAGSFDTMKAAYKAGADAVYMGGPMVEYYLWSIDVGRADPEKPNSKESKGRKGFWNYE